MNYADSSFLVSLYGAETHSVMARTMLRRSQTGLWFTPLHRVEFENAVAQNELRQILNRAQGAAFTAAMEADLRGGVLSATEVSAAAWSRCAALAREFGRQIFIRTLDTLHVACALELGAGEFWSFDRRQALLADRVGLTLRP